MGATRRHLLSAFGLAALSAIAHADSDSYSIGVQETITRDSNVFRAPDGTQFPAGSGATRADWSSVTSVIGAVDQWFGRERVKLNGELDFDRFKDNTQLNSTAHSVDAELDGSTVNHLSGEVGYSSSAQLYRYNLDALELETSRNVLSTQSGFVRVHLGQVTRWTFDAALEALNQTFSAADYRPQDLRRHDFSLGATFADTPDLSIGLTGKRTVGDYPNLTSEQTVDGELQQVATPDHFWRNDLILGLTYAATGASTLKVRVSTGNEHHSSIASRSSHAWSADGQWMWIPTGRTQVTFDFLRDDDTGSTDATLFAANADARRRTAIAGRVDYEATGKVKVHASGSFAHRDLDSAFANSPELDVQGSDRLYNAALGFDYVPFRNGALGCEVSRERRTTQGGSLLSLTFPYDADVASCHLKVLLN